MIVTYFLAILIGISLGLIGGGGSILTVPILVYFADIPPVLATSYSLLIVGVGAAIAAYQKQKSGLVKLNKAIYFGLPSIISIYLTRNYILPSIPEEILTVNGFIISKELFVMLFFAFIMFLASFSMINGKNDNDIKSKELHKAKIGVIGFVVGLLVGIVGAGGGFLIVPSLVSFMGLKTKEAIGTSLLIISFNSLFGFLGDYISGVRLDYQFLLVFIVISVIGIFVGNKLSIYVTGNKLKKSFGYFILIMSILILMKETNLI
jgi:uncharacterized membrane protein YfcA